MMRDLWEYGILGRILVLTVFGIMLGYSPQPHDVALSLKQAGRAQSFNSSGSTARNLAVVASHVQWRDDLWEQAGDYALQANEPELAIVYYKQAAGMGVLSLPGYLRFGDAYQSNGNLYTAVQIWQISKHDPGTSRGSLTRLADAQRVMRDYPGLINSLKGLILLQPGDADLTYELGLLLTAFDPTSAPSYLQAAELAPELEAANELAFTIQRALPRDNPTYTLMAAGRKLADLNYWELAAHAFGRVAASTEDYAEGWAYLGEALQHLEPEVSEQIHTPGAHNALEKAVQLDPGSLSANTLMALYWSRDDNPERARTYLSQAESIDPDSPDIQVDLGAITAVLGDLEAAEAHYRKAIQLAPDQDIFYLGEFVEFCIRYNIDLKNVALPVARQMMLSEPDNPASLDIMGQIIFRLGDLYSAERFLTRAINLDPAYAPAHLHLGLVYYLQGKSNQAAQAYKAALALAPGTQTAALASRFLDNLTTP